MKAPRLLWLRRLVLAAVLAVALGWLPYQVYGRSGLAHLVKLHGELDTLRRESGVLRDENVRLRAEIALYDEDDLAAIERVARDELGLVKPGELVFKIEGDPVVPGAVPAAANTSSDAGALH